MTLPTSADLLNMEYSFQSQPFIDVPAKSTITLVNMEYAYRAQPFVRNEGGLAHPAFSSLAQKLLAAGII